MQTELLDAFSQRALAEENHALQAPFLDTAHEPLGVGIGMSLRMHRMATVRIDFSE